MNFGKRGASISVGPKGFKKTFHSSGRVTTTASIPGTGISYTTSSRTASRNFSRPCAQRVSSSRKPLPPKKKITTLILCLFLGIFGAHRFYVRKTGSGILWLLTCGLLGIGWIVDIILIISNHFLAADGSPLVHNSSVSSSYGTSHGSDTSAPAETSEATTPIESSIKAPATEEASTLVSSEKGNPYNARLGARIARQKERETSFVAELEALSRAPISTDGPEIKKKNISDISDLKYSNITVRSDIQKLGRFVVVDTETTGIRATSSIVEVSAIRFVDFEPVELFTTLIKPPKPIPLDASSINGITDDMVSESPRIWEIIPSLISFIDGWSIVGHNLPFDLKFLYRDGLDIQPKQRLYDTLDLISRILKKPKRKWDNEIGSYSDDYDTDYDVDNYKLGTLCAYYDIPLAGAHRSSADCLATGKLFHEIVNAKHKSTLTV